MEPGDGSVAGGSEKTRGARSAVVPQAHTAFPPGNSLRVLRPARVAAAVATRQVARMAR